ncbi:MAG: D-alanyl-D-alanine carboxypeptidase/D-alanyl-D-alanine-endopeptidase, partial [Actinomycetota bacterium]|nr:D-alanyl-D-alanine carboxypeptidase/D-alanyl-D-alanine-endopeptidase [Actinomycetota bacterium]
LSLRRVPELLAAAVGTNKLDAALKATLADPRFGGAANACLMVQAGGVPIYIHNPTLPLVPASNLKLLTATAALDRLPSGDRLVTKVMGDAAPRNGTLAGNLYLVGGGDPQLRTPDYVANLHFPAQIFDNLITLAEQVRAAGVTQVTGSVVGDETRYDTQRYIPTWPARYMTNGEVGPLSALSVNDGFATSKPGPAAAQPAQQAAAVFSTLLQARGVTVAGAAQAGRAPPAAVKISEFASAPLPDLVDEILRRSDNNGAELITKELGRQANSATPTTAAGVASIQAALQADGLPTAGLHMVDGSGLDRSDRVTCQVILDALLRSGPDGILGRGLAIAGTSGTLYRRMIGTPAAGRLRAKSGSLEGVSALSGFVTAAPGPVGATGAGSATSLTFSLITNSSPSLAAGDALCDRVGVLLAQFPQAPPVADLGPLPGP